MARKVFFSFHYKPDNWRASQVRNIGAIEGNRPCSDNDWESVTKGGDTAIRKWIADQMSGKSCVVVLVGSNTARRKWIDYEITKAWQDGKGIVGVNIHNLKHRDGEQCAQGDNPFAHLTLGTTPLSSIVRCYNPPYLTSNYVYDHVSTEIDGWIEEAIRTRGKY